MLIFLIQKILVLSRDLIQSQLKLSYPALGAIGYDQVSIDTVHKILNNVEPFQGNW